MSFLVINCCAKNGTETKRLKTTTILLSQDLVGQGFEWVQLVLLQLQLRVALFVPLYSRSGWAATGGSGWGSGCSDLGPCRSHKAWWDPALEVPGHPVCPILFIQGDTKSSQNSRRRGSDTFSKSITIAQSLWNLPLESGCDHILSASPRTSWVKILFFLLPASGDLISQCH